MADNLNHDFPADNSVGAVRAYYRRTNPLYDAYHSVIEEYNTHTGAITDPPTGGVNTQQAARMALSRIGYPDHDNLTVQMAMSHLERLEAEILASADPVPPTVERVLVDYFFDLCGVFPTVEGWEAFEAYEQRDACAELADLLPDEVLPELLALAMPSLIGHVITEDEKRRNPLRLVDGQLADEQGGDDRG